MKPSFALDFRDGLVTLLHRTSRGWSQVGSTAFDAPDFAEALGYMRSTALGLSPRGITTKLIIPNDQILYTPIHAPGPDAPKRKRQIKAGLEGRTPYPVEDLVYDWWGNGPDLNVAVIAKETLAEAEAFATEHRFNPVSFVGVPDNGIFLGEPYFGPTALAATLLTEGEKVERDQEPVTIIARDFQRGDTRAKAAEPLPEPVAEAPEEAASEPVAEELPPQPESVAEVELEAPAPAPEEAPTTPVVEAAALSEPAAQEPVAPVRVAAPEPAPTEPVFEPVRAPAPRPNRPLPVAQVPVEAPEAPMAMDVVSEAPARPEDDLPAPPAAEIVAAFANRRSAAIAAATAGTAKQAGAAGPKVPQVGPAPAAQRPTVPRPNAARPAPASARDIPRETARDTLPFPAKQNGAAVKPQAGKAAKPISPSVTAASIIGAKRERNVVALPTAGTPEEQAAAAARRAAVKPPTGLGSRAAPVKGKPRYLGLILTVALLLLLVAVAAWSSFFMGANDTTGTGAGVPETTSPTASLPAPAAAPDSTPPQATTPTTTAEVTAPQPAPVATGTATATVAAANPEPTPAAPQTSDQTASLTTGASTASAPTAAAAPQDALASAAPMPDAAKVSVPPALEPAPKTEVSTVAVPAVVPSTSPQDKFVVAIADTPPKPFGPTALPAVAAGADASPAAEPPPPPYGTVYKFDADGRIIPTPEGILTPEGVLLIAGKPKLAPPPRPAELAPVATAPAAPATDTSAAATAVAPVTPAPSTEAAIAPALATSAAEPAAPALVPDPTLADKRPKDRPANLAPVLDQQGAVAAAPDDTRLAALHPAARPRDLPASPLAPDTGADATAASASLAANGFALSSSLKPVARPSGLDRTADKTTSKIADKAVDEAVADALNEPAPETQLASANVAPEAQSEPDVEAPAPNLPTNANVAKQATTKRAINTNKLSLLAVFGTPSTRFAMVRQGNGAIKKIKVGDTVDGGSVAAITENSVQYQKGGRIVTLSLPTG